VDLERLRLAVYRGLASDGRAPSESSLAAATGWSVDDVRDGLRALAEARHLVLDAGGRIVLAHPFGGTPLGFSVMGRQTLWWGGCCWDAFAIPHLVPDEPSVLVATTCPGCGRALAWTVSREAPTESPEVAHFLVPMAHVWDDVLRACGNQRIFCDEGCVDRWLGATGESKGYVMDLPQLWRLASGWYAGRLDRGYVRREPVAAREYFREAGLSGPFWGLD
jgi:alkylmercury lyase-like protein